MTDANGLTAEDLGLNEQDSVDDAMAWLSKGTRIDAKHFEKVLPHTAQDLVNGTIPPEQLRDKMWRRALNPMLKARHEDGFEGTFLGVYCNLLSKMTLLEKWCRNSEQKEWLFQARSGFARDLRKRCEDMDEMFTNGYRASTSDRCARNVQELGSAGR